MSNTFMFTTDPPRVQRWLADPASDLCEHVEADHAQAFSVRGEDDSFGPVCRAVLCRACNEQAQAEDDVEDVVCQDCHGHFPRRETRAWRWYDFYAAQGDEEVILCLECWRAPRHQQRMAADRRAEAEELGDDE